MNKDNYSKVCKRCGRPLTDEISKRRGFGPECFNKHEKSKVHQRSLFSIDAITTANSQ